MAFKLVTLIVLFLLAQVNSSWKHLVQTNCRSYSNSCRTFNDYANDADTYFTSDSSFHFMKGTHHLNVTLFITNVVNLSFVGDESDIILSNGCSIIWTRSSEISLSYLRITFSDTDNETKKSALHFKNSSVVTLSNISFFKLHYFYSRAVLVVGSSIVFLSCKFINGNHTEGGTIYIENSNVTLFGHNYFLSYTGYYGGAVFGSNSQIHFSGNGTLVGNKVRSAIYIMSTNISFNGSFKFYDKELLKYDGIFFFHFGGTIAAMNSIVTMHGVFHFVNNTNILGGAIHLSNTKCIIVGLLKIAGNTVLLYGGAIYARSSSLTIQSDESASRFDSFNSECLSKSYPQSIIFCNNSAEKMGGAIHLEDSNMTLTGSVVFVANKAQNGGGISISFTSEPRINDLNFLVFQEPLNMLFYENVAKKFGGAMYINDRYLNTRLCEYLFPRMKIINKCFFTVNLGLKRFININFTSNDALAGAGIYGGAIQYCLVEVGNKIQNGYQVLQDFIKNSTKIQNLYDNFDSIKVRYCINGTTPDTLPSFIHHQPKVQRGQVFNISVTVLGEFDFPVSKRVAFTLNSNNDKSSSQIIGGPYNYLKEKGCRNLGFKIRSKGQKEQIKFHPSQCPFSTAMVTLSIFLDDCLPGFVLIGNDCKCQETLYKMTGHEDLCDSSTGLIKCPQQDWMKPILDENLTYQGFMWSPNCPAHLCRNNKDNWLNFSSDNVDFICLEYHTAMLCGACLQNYSLTLSSLKCSKCSSNNYLSLLLVFTLAGVALIASLILLHMTVAEGAINGLIFYANVINITKDIVFPPDSLPLNPLTLFLSWLNLDYGIQTCFYTGLDYYSYTWLQFVFPFYLWFLVGLIILACKYSSRAMKLFGSNPVAVLATVVLMSYSKLLHTSQEILSYVTVYYSNGTQEKRWKMDPNLLYFQGKHIPLAVFGLLILIAFLIPCVVLITFGHYLQKYSNKRGLKWLIKIKPIFDAYYAPFCKNTHYWVGLMLFTRTCLSIAYCTLKNTERTAILVIVASVLTGITSILWLQHKIYHKNFINVLEGSFILNVIILSIATYATREDRNHQLVLYYISVGMAFTEFIVILVFHLWHRFNLKWPYMKYCKSTSAKFLSNQRAPKEKDVDKPGGSISTTIVFDIREPLLDDSITEL